MQIRIICLFFFWGGVLQDKIRTGGSEQGRTLPSNTRTRIGQTLGIVSGHPDTLRMRRLAEAHLIAGCLDIIELDR